MWVHALRSPRPPSPSPGCRAVLDVPEGGDRGQLWSSYSERYRAFIFLSLVFSGLDREVGVGLLG